MRKLLLATTAMAGAALFAGAAQAHQGMEVTVGGYSDFQAGFMSEDLSLGGNNGYRHNDFRNEFQLEIEAKNKAANGMEYGVVASLWNGIDNSFNQTQNDVRLHQTYGYVNGAFGQVRLGDSTGVVGFRTAAPMSYDWGAQVDGYYTEFVSAGQIFAIQPHFLDNDDNSTNVTYMTPKLGYANQKIQAGVSFKPNSYGQGSQVTLFSPSTGAVAAGTGGQLNAYTNVVEAGARYEGGWMDRLNTVIAGVITTGDGAKDAFTVNGVGGQTRRDFTSWDVGAQIGYAGFTLGGNYTDAGAYNVVDGQNRDQHVWSAGLGYKFDRASFAGSYLQGRGYSNALNTTLTPFGGITNDTNYQEYYRAFGAGAGYSLFDGMTTSVDAMFFKSERPGAVGNNEGHVIILSNRIAF